MSINDRIREAFTPEFIELLQMVAQMRPEQLDRFMPVARHILQQDGQEKNGN